jgi:malate synthase
MADLGDHDAAISAFTMAGMRRQILLPRYIQHSARAIFMVGQATPQEHGPLLDAIRGGQRKA